MCLASNEDPTAVAKRKGRDTCAAQAAVATRPPGAQDEAAHFRPLD